MDNTTVQVISVLVIALTITLIAVSTIVTRERVRRRRPMFSVRSIPAYDIMPTLAGQAIESDRPMHLSLGSAGIGGSSTLLALAGAELFYHVAARASIGDTSPILTLTDSSALPLAQDTLRRAYQSRGRGERFRYTSVRWYPSGGRSLAFAAAVTALMGDDRAASNILAGSFGPELSLIMDASFRRGLPAIAVSDQLEGQAIAYALSDHALIGEEVFVAGAYLGGGTSQVAGMITLDVLRWLVILGILGGMILSLVGNRGG